MGDGMKFEIEFLEDSHDCETCGWSAASGFIIRKDGEVIVNKIPAAYCFDSRDYSSDSPYLDLLYYLHPDIQINIKETEDA